MAQNAANKGDHWIQKQICLRLLCTTWSMRVLNGFSGNGNISIFPGSRWVQVSPYTKMHLYWPDGKKMDFDTS